MVLLLKMCTAWPILSFVRGFQGTQVTCCKRKCTQVTILSHGCSSCPLLYMILLWALSFGTWFFSVLNFDRLDFHWFLILMHASWQQIYVATFNKLTGSFTDTYVGQECKNKVHMNFLRQQWCNLLVLVPGLFLAPWLVFAIT